MMRRFLLIAGILLINSQLYAQEPGQIADSLFYGTKGYIHNQEVVGANIGIIYRDAAYYYSYGYTDKGKSKKIDTSTVFEIGGVTKAFTGLLMANAINKDVLDTKIVVERYIPVNNALVNKIRIIDLATGISGLPTLNAAGDLVNVPNADAEQPFKAVDKPYLVSVITGATKLDDQGTYKNSNYAFSLLGLILGAANKTDYNTLLQQTVLEPLQLSHTTTTLPKGADMAKGYEEGKPRPYMELTAMAPALILKSTVTDMAKFLKYEITPADSLPLAKDIQYSQQVQYVGPYLESALGWEIAKMDSSYVYYMHGKTYGFSAVIAFDRSKRIGIVVMLNTNDEYLTEDALKYIHTSLIPKPWKHASYKKPHPKAVKKKHVIKK